ncbi:MAG: tetratricopeptide repeat protein [Pseudomonadota bacterium]
MALLFSTSRLATAAMLAGALALAGCDSVEDRIAEHLSRAQELRLDGESEKAIIEFRNVLKLKGDHVEARLGIAQLLEDKGNFQAAVGHYLVAVDNDVTNVDARVRLAQYMLVTNQLDRALELSEQAYEIDPRRPDVLAVRASTAFQLDNKEYAVELASKAVELEPTHAAANVVLITHRVEQGDLESAIATTESVLEAHPNDLSLQLLKLRLLELAERGDAALEQLEKIVEMFPDIPTARRALATQYYRRGNIEASEEQYRAVAELRGMGDVEAQLDVVRFQLAVRGEAAATEELVGLVERADNKWAYQRALAALYRQTDRPDEAEAMLQAIVDSGSGNVTQAKVLLAQYALGADDRVRGEALVDSVLEQDAGNVDAISMRGALQIERQEYEAAIETLRVGLANAPDDVRLLLLSGRAHLLNGNDALGSDQLATATRASDYRPEVTQEYVRYLLQRGRLDAAEAVLAESARRSPDNQVLLSALAELRLRQEDWSGAEAVAQQLRELEGGGDVAEQVLAASLTGQERFEESAEILKGLANTDENVSSTLPTLVRNLVQAERPDEARTAVDRVLQDDPNNFEARMLEASLAQNEQGTEASIALFEQILADFPDRPEIYFIMYRIRGAQGRLDEAIGLVETGIESTGGNSRLRMLRAGIAERQGDFDTAIDQYQAVFDAEPDSMIAANNLASTLAEHRADSPEEVERAARIALRLRGTQVPEMKDTLGWTLYLSGSHREARDVLEEAAAALPDNPYVQYHLGMTYAALDMGAEARAALELARDRAAGTAFPHLETVDATLASLPAEAPEGESGTSGQ